jgi:hypothetical protein
VIFGPQAGSSQDKPFDAAADLLTETSAARKEHEVRSRKKQGMFGVLVVALIGLLAIALPGAAAARDRNHDKIPDRWERSHHLSLHKNQAKRDQDRDNLKNRKEFKAGTNPRDADTDDDGVPDGEENAGTVASFDGTTLTINLFNGSAVSGTVTDSTEIQCETADTGDNGDPGDDNSGTGDDDASGGDNGQASAPASSSDDGDQGDTGDGDTGDDDGGNGDDDGDNGDDDGGDGGTQCTTADLVPGAVVHQAELDLESGQATFEEIELVK